MSKPALSPAPHNLHILMLLLLLLPALACKTLIPGTVTPLPASTDEPINGIETMYPTDIETMYPTDIENMYPTDIETMYPTGIETYRLDSGTIAVVDTIGYYCMAFPAEWEVGAFHEDFIPTVETYAQIHEGVKLLFDALYGKDDSLRIFAIDTYAGHLSESNMTAIHIGMFQEDWRLKLTLDDITTEYIAYATSSGEIQITNTLLGRSTYDIPYVLLLTETTPTENLLPVHGGTALIKTDYAYLEVVYTTLDKSTPVAEEMYPILNSFTTCTD